MHHHNHRQVLHEQFATPARHADGSASAPGGGAHCPGAQQRPTVIQIAHELSAIMAYDSVIVMAGGQVVEQGAPAALAADEGSRFARLLAQHQHQQHKPA